MTLAPANPAACGLKRFSMRSSPAGPPRPAVTQAGHNQAAPGQASQAQTGPPPIALSVAKAAWRARSPPAAGSHARAVRGPAASQGAPRPQDGDPATSPNRLAAHSAPHPAVRLDRNPPVRPSVPSAARKAKAHSVPGRHAQPRAPVLARQAQDRRASPAGSQSPATVAPANPRALPAPSLGRAVPANRAIRASLPAPSGQALPAEKSAASSLYRRFRPWGSLRVDHV
jgi:hypothetical protein